MDLVQSNIHMDMVKCKAVSQITMEDDINLKEDCPDISRIIMQEGTVNISECRASADHVTVKGTLDVSILYLTEEEEETLGSMCGKLPFEEVVFAEGIQAGDTVDVICKIEDLSVGMINSRKMSIRSILTFTLQADALYDEMAATDLICEESERVEYRKKQMQIAKLSVRTRDVCRVHQEGSLPNGYPNIYRLIYKSIRIVHPEFKPRDNEIHISGELEVFLLYDSGDEEENIRFYETQLPFRAVVECHGSTDMMIPDIRWTITALDFEVKPDFDGEERSFAIDLTLQLCIKLYEESQVSLLSDVYGIRDEVLTEGKKGSFRKILLRNDGRCRVEETISLNEAVPILQMLHMQGEVSLEDYTIAEDGMQVEGIMTVKSLFVTQDDKMPYMADSQSFPFTYLLEAKGLPKDCICNVEVSLDQLSGIVTDTRQLEVKAVLTVSGLFMEEFEEELIDRLNVQPLGKQKMAAMPGIVIYFVQPGDTLYQIGKKYYMPVDKIRQLNDLEGDTILPGQQLILMRDV